MFGKSLGLIVAGIYLSIPHVVIAEEVVVSDPERPNWSFYGAVSASEVDAVRSPGGKMIRLDVKEKGSNYWDSAATTEPLGKIEEGQIVTLGFFAKATSQDGPVWVNANVGRIAAPYDTAVIARIDLDQEERFYCLEGVSKIALRRGKAKVTLHIGGEQQILDIGPYIVTTRDTADGPSQLPCDRVIRSW